MLNWIISWWRHLCHFFYSQIDLRYIREEFVTHGTLPASHRQLQKWLLSWPRASPFGHLSMSWDSGEMTWCCKMGKRTVAPSIVMGLQGVSFILCFPNLGVGIHSCLLPKQKGQTMLWLVMEYVVQMRSFYLFALKQQVYFYYCVSLEWNLRIWLLKANNTARTEAKAWESLGLVFSFASSSQCDLVEVG